MENENRLIAEFMGALTTNANGDIKEDLSQLHYNTSWDWLMPVIKKIDSYANEKMTFAEYDDYRKSNWRMIDRPSKHEISQVHKQVVQFIQWYKENK